MISSNLSMACWTKMASLRFRVLRILQSAPYLHYIMIWKCYITVLYSIIFTLQRNLISIFPPLCLTLNYAAQLTFDPGGFNQFFHGHWFQNHIKSNIFQEVHGRIWWLKININFPSIYSQTIDFPCHNIFRTKLDLHKLKYIYCTMS